MVIKKTTHFERFDLYIHIYKFYIWKVNTNES